MTPLSAHQKSYGPPFQLIKKVMTHPHILPAPSGRNNEQSIITCSPIENAVNNPFSDLNMLNV